MGGVNGGVIQGCPAAALLSVVGVDPFVVLFDRYVHDPFLGLVRFCAGGCGSVVKTWQSLSTMFK
eukprot:10753358-Karenia_brevis.AAC.1